MEGIKKIQIEKKKHILKLWKRNLKIWFYRSKLTLINVTLLVKKTTSVRKTRWRNPLDVEEHCIKRY